MRDLIKLIMTRRFPEIPSTTREEQDALRDQLMIEARKREASAEAGLEDEPPRKVRRVVPDFVSNIIEVEGEANPDEPTIIKIIPGMDPYQQLLKEEDADQYLVGDDESSETHPDDTTADDLSHITIDSLKHIDNEKVKDIWRGMAKLKHQEGEYYNNSQTWWMKCRLKPSTSQWLPPPDLPQTYHNALKTSSNVWGARKPLEESLVQATWHGRSSKRTVTKSWVRSTSRTL